MILRCAVCGHEQDAEHLAVACGGCGARGALKIKPVGGVKPGEPAVGRSRVPIGGGSRAAMRGRYEEPVEVTRERAAYRQALILQGSPLADAREAAERKVPVQCGLCGGQDRGCRVCLGRASAPTEELAARRAAASKPRKRPARKPKRPAGRVARVRDA